MSESTRPKECRTAQLAGRPMCPVRVRECYVVTHNLIVFAFVDQCRRWLRFVAVSDPGRLRLRSAASTALSAALAMGVLAGVAAAWQAQITLSLLGTVVAVQASAAVKDSTHAQRIITTVLMPLPAMAAVALAAALLDVGILAEIGFIGVLFAAVWVRRWEPRGTALGMVAFIAYFFSLFLHADLGQVPRLCGAIVIGVLCTVFVRVVVLPERPRLEIRRLAHALRAGSLEVLAAARQRDRRSQERLRRRLDRLGATALMIEDWIDRHDSDELVSITGRALSTTVFDAQIATEQLATVLWSLDAAQPDPPALSRVRAALFSVLQGRLTGEQLREAWTVSAQCAREADTSRREGIATLAAHRAVQAHIGIHRVSTRALSLRSQAGALVPSPGVHGAGSSAGRSPTDGAVDGEAVEDQPRTVEAVAGRAEADGSGDGAGAGAGQPGPAGRRTGLRARAGQWAPSTRAAIQVAVATSAATLAGSVVSPERWYWAVLTAFLVFNGASTRGEILSRAGHRIVGTIAGVIAGVVIAALVGHDPPVQMVLIVVCIFFAFYFAPVAYAILTFCVTVLLAMLYGLLGVFSIDVLGLRIAETAVGAIVGIASAYFILATSTRSELRTKTTEYLDELVTLVSESIEAVSAPGRSREVVEAARRLDNALQEVLTAAKPLELRPTARSRRGAKRLTRVLTAANRSAHQLARAAVMAARADPDTTPSKETVQSLREAGTHVRATADLVRRSVGGEIVRRPERSTEPTVLDVLLTATRTPGALRLAVRSLSGLNRALFEAVP